MPLISTCFISLLYSYCTLENGSLYTTIRVDDELHVFIDGEPLHVIKNGHET